MKKPTMVPPASHRDFGVTLRTQKPRSTWPPNASLREVFLRYLSFPDASAGSWSGLLSSVRSSSGSSDRSLEQPSWMTWVLSYQCLNIFRKICWFALSNSSYIKLQVTYLFYSFIWLQQIFRIPDNSNDSSTNPNSGSLYAPVDLQSLWRLCKFMKPKPVK